MNIDESSTCQQSRSHQLLQQQLVARSFDMSKEIEHVQYVSTYRKDKKIVDMLPKTATCRTATFDMSKQRSTCWVCQFSQQLSKFSSGRAIVAFDRCQPMPRICCKISAAARGDAAAFLLTGERWRHPEKK